MNEPHPAQMRATVDELTRNISDRLQEQTSGLPLADLYSVARCPQVRAALNQVFRAHREFDYLTRHAPRGIQWVAARLAVFQAGEALESAVADRAGEVRQGAVV